MSSKRRSGSLAWTDDWLKEAFNDPRTSFCGDQCFACKATANVIVGAGWLCECGEYIVLMLDDNGRSHENPTYGPTGSQLQRAVNEVRDKGWLERMGLMEP
jgi:hypothetical protein